MAAWEVFDVRTSDVVEVVVMSHADADDYVATYWGAFYDFDVCRDASANPDVPCTTMMRAG